MCIHNVHKAFLNLFTGVDKNLELAPCIPHGLKGRVDAAKQILKNMWR